MKLPRLKTVLITPLVLFAMFYVALAIKFALDDDSVATTQESLTDPKTVVIFGASGTAGDGILKAALASPNIEKIHVITRRETPRIEEGVALGKVQLTLHMDYLDYSSVLDQIAEADAAYCAIGTSTFGVDEETYGRIHVDFPVQFVAAWVRVSEKPDMSFHYISSSDISADSRMMWARENELHTIAQPMGVSTYLYRNDYGQVDKLRQLGNHVGFDLDQSQYSYDNDGRLTQRTLPSSQVVTYAFNGLGQVTSVNSGTTSCASNRSACTRKRAATRHWTRLTATTLAEELSRPRMPPTLATTGPTVMTIWAA